MTEHRYPSFARDNTISLGARGVLSVMVAPENRDRWLSINDLSQYVTDRPDAVRPLLIELSRAGYVDIAHSPDGDVWQANSRSYVTSR